MVPDPFTPAQLGLKAGLAQIWSSSAAVAQYGSLGHGLQLPLPANFVAVHPGQPLEVYVIELQFNNTKASQTLLSNKDYNFHLPIYQNIVTSWPQTINGGWAYPMAVPIDRISISMGQWRLLEPSCSVRKCLHSTSHDCSSAIEQLNKRLVWHDKLNYTCDLAWRIPESGGRWSEKSVRFGYFSLAGTGALSTYPG